MINNDNAVQLMLPIVHTLAVDQRADLAAPRIRPSGRPRSMPRPPGRRLAPRPRPWQRLCGCSGGAGMSWVPGGPCVPCCRSGGR